MAPFIHELSNCLAGPVCLVGLGNSDFGDDGFGMWMINAVARNYFSLAGRRSQILNEGDHCKLWDTTFLAAGRSPENWISFFGTEDFRHVLFIDAVEIRKPPGTIAWLDSQKIRETCNSMSTHKLSLSIITQLIEGPQVWLLGVQPEVLIEKCGLSERVEKTAHFLNHLFQDLLAKKSNNFSLNCVGGAA